MRIIKRFIYMCALWLMLVCLSGLVLGADAEKTRALLEDEQGRIVAVSHRGDVSAYPANSLEGIRAASKKGADAVSVAVSITKDGVPVLCEDISLGNICDTDKSFIADVTAEEFFAQRLYDSYGALTEIKPVSLEEALKELKGKVYLILDISPDSLDAVYEVLRSCGALGEASVRMKQSASKIVAESGGNLDIIGIYTGNIIWNSKGHIDKLSAAGMTTAEYHTKNHFNVCYGTLVGDSFSAEGKARASAAAFDTDLCGKRSDSAEGWDQLVNDGFTVIETNNIEALCEYISCCENEKEKLSELVAKAEKTDLSSSSQVSRKNIEYAVRNGKTLLDGRAKPLSLLQKAYSDIAFSLNNNRISEGEEETTGALNITGGKVAVFVIIGAVIFAAQIFVDKKKKAKQVGGK